MPEQGQCEHGLYLCRRGGAAEKSHDTVGLDDYRSREVLIGVIKGGGEIE